MGPGAQSVETMNIIEIDSDSEFGYDSDGRAISPPPALLRPSPPRGPALPVARRTRVPKIKLPGLAATPTATQSSPRTASSRVAAATAASKATFTRRAIPKRKAPSERSPGERERKAPERSPGEREQLRLKQLRDLFARAKGWKERLKVLNDLFGTTRQQGDRRFHAKCLIDGPTLQRLASWLQDLYNGSTEQQVCSAMHRFRRMFAALGPQTAAAVAALPEHAQIVKAIRKLMNKYAKDQHGGTSRVSWAATILCETCN